MQEGPFRLKTLRECLVLGHSVCITGETSYAKTAT